MYLAVRPLNCKLVLGYQRQGCARWNRPSYDKGGKNTIKHIYMAARIEWAHYLPSSSVKDSDER
jgi:hypothetical protein